MIYRVDVAAEGTKPVTLRGYRNAKAVASESWTANSSGGFLEKEAISDVLFPPVRSGLTLVSSTASTSVLHNDHDESDNDYYKGRIIVITGGTGSGQWAVITAYTQSTNTISVAPSWTTTPDGTSIYTIENGSKVFTVAVAKTGSATIDLVDGLIIPLSPGETFVVTAQSTASSEITASVSVIEKA